MKALEVSTSKKQKKGFEDLIKEYLSKDLDAQLFCSCFFIYAHAIDDIIDTDLKNDPEYIIKTYLLSATVYNNRFYLENFSRLYPIIKTVSLDYLESVKMEMSPVLWKREHSDVLRQTGTKVLLECIEILNGLDTRLRVTEHLRELSYYCHHDENGCPL